MMTKNAFFSKCVSALRWLDENILLVFTGFFLAFIPLYPKLPLADLITGYIVRMRLEDLTIAVAAVIWFVQVIRRKISLKTPLTIIVSLYLLVGFISCLSAMFWTHTVPLTWVHVAKLFLHYFRRIEYFSLFFVAYAAMKKQSQLFVLLGVFVFAVFGVSIYGIGQKYLYWPVYSTMNREFSKGLRLYLTEHARVQSTFGGHYDFAAFLVIALPLLFVLFYLVKKRWMRIFLAITFLCGLWGLMMTSSRSSFLAYLGAMTIIMILIAVRKRWMGILWGLANGVVIYAFTFSFMFLFGDLSMRFAQIFQGDQAWVEAIEFMRKQAQAPIVEAPKDAISIDDVAAAAAEAERLAQLKASPSPSPSLRPVIDQSDTRPSTSKPGELPPDVFLDIPDRVIATRSAEGKEIVVVIPRVFSENAHRLGLSAAIRLDTLWPFAIRGFLRNPLFGSGYSTLTKYAVDQFTEAESTDNDFLRTLGETGALGFITFYGTMVVGLIFLWKKARKTKDSVLKALTIGLTGVTLGLMVNAVYIDVFVSSKIIQTYWLLMGSVIAYANLEKPVMVQPIKVQKKLKSVKQKRMK